jgi:hypothetical protein
MNRVLALLTLAVVSLAACGEDDKVEILVFQAAPDSIEAGQSTQLVFAVDPSDAKVNISGLGDLTGQTNTSVTPTATTSYQLTATSGKATATQSVTVMVGSTTANAIKVEPALATPLAGDQLAVTLTVLGPNGKPAPGFRGTLHITSTDTHATLPPDQTFTAGDAGVKQISVTLATAGPSALIATEVTGKAAIAGSATLTVRPAAAQGYQLSTLPATAVAGESLLLTVTVLDRFGNVATSYNGQMRMGSSDGTDVLPAAGAFVNGVRTVSLAFTKVGNHTAQVQDVGATLPPVDTSGVAIGPAAPFSVALAPASQATAAGATETFTAKVFDFFGNSSTNYTGTLHFVASDIDATVPGDFTFGPGDAGSHDFSVTLKTAGTTTLAVTDTAVSGIASSTSWIVIPAAAASYRLTTLPGAATAGQSLVLTVTVLDVFGNIATAYTGQMRMVSGDPHDILPPAGSFVNGQRSVSLAFTKVGSHIATVQDVALTLQSADTNAVAISPAAPFRVAVAPAHPTTIAGTSEAFTATLFDFYDNLSTNYTGTLHFAATDPQADVPADFAFGAADAGSHGFSITLKTAGSESLAVSDTVVAGLSGSAAWVVGAAAADRCVASQAPATAPAGTVLGLTVAARDPFGNAATGYAGTVRLTATDGRANLPPDVTYSAGDAGSHAFSVSLLTTGSQTVTATDTANAAITCSLGVMITPAAPKLVLSVPTNANAGYAVDVGVQIKDLFDNAIPTYAGTVTFASTDTGSGAATPAPITFTGSEGGTVTTSATFVTIGTQTLSASDAGTPQAAGTTAANVHGLVYTAPNTGRVRLVANQAQTNANSIQFDLVANERLEISTFFGGGPGSFSAGMDLPLDTTRIGAGTPLFTSGNALVITTPPPAIPPIGLGVLGNDHVLYTVVSRKRVAGTIFNQVTEVQAGQVFYSVKLKLTANGPAGTVFDGAAPLAMYRAGVRDQWGNDFVGQSDIGVGKLEIR